MGSNTSSLGQVSLGCVRKLDSWTVVVHGFNPSTLEAESGKSLSSKHSELNDSQSHTKNPALRKQKRKLDKQQTCEQA